MSNPDKAVAHNDFPEEGKKEKASTENSFDAADYEKQVVTAVNEMEFDEAGKWTPPEGMSNEMQYAVNSERRRRDTQTSQQEATQSVKRAEAKVKALTNKLEGSIRPKLTVEQAEELEDLKESNPEAWREKLNEYDSKAYDEYVEEIEEIDQDTEADVEIERRTEVFERFKSDNPELKLDNNVFENDLPPRITGKLKEGELTFEEFLEEAKEYLLKGKKIVNTGKGEEEEPNLGKSGGTTEATNFAVKGDIKESYDNEVF